MSSDSTLLDALGRAAIAAQGGATLADGLRAEAGSLGATALELAAAVDGVGLAAGLERRGLLSPLQRAAIEAAGRDPGRMLEVVGRLRHEVDAVGRHRRMLRGELMLPLFVVFVGISIWSLIAVILNTFAYSMATGSTAAVGLGAPSGAGAGAQIRAIALAGIWPSVLAASIAMVWLATRCHAPKFIYFLPRLGQLRRRSDSWELVRALIVARGAGLALQPALSAFGARAPSEALAEDLERACGALQAGQSPAAAIEEADGLPSDVGFMLGGMLGGQRTPDQASLTRCAATIDSELRREILETGYATWLGLVILVVGAILTNHPATAMQPLVELIQMMG